MHAIMDKDSDIKDFCHRETVVWAPQPYKTKGTSGMRSSFLLKNIHHKAYHVQFGTGLASLTCGIGLNSYSSSITIVFLLAKAP